MQHLPRLKPAPDPLKVAVMQATNNLAGFQPHRIHGLVTASDGKALVEDLRVLCNRVFDPLLLAYAQYAEQHGLEVDLDDAREIVWWAIDGNLTYEIESSARMAEIDREDSAEDTAAESRREFAEGR
jgi:hypothetical protein